jgi:hypothetical protein
MAIKRYYANIDNTITNAFKGSLVTRGTGSNMGAADILETFVIHGQTSASISAANAEQSRVLIHFPVDTILSDITAGSVPSSSVSYTLKMFNAPHAGTTPLSYSLDVAIAKSEWIEGRGLDMDNYTDLGASNWGQRKTNVAWTTEGGDYYRDSDFTNVPRSASYFFSGGVEDLTVNIDFAMDRWRAGAVNNYGFLIKNSDKVISGSLGSFYTKKFFGRTSEYFLKRPYIQAEWDSSRQDNRGNFAVSSSLLTGEDNLNTLYLYNVINGQLKNIPHLAKNYLRVAVYSALSGAAIPGLIVDGNNNTVTYVTGGLLNEFGTDITGIYTASFACTGTQDVLYDVWYTGSVGPDFSSNPVQYFTGSYEPQVLTASPLIYEDKKVTTIANLEPTYRQGQQPRLRAFIRKYDWNPNIYNVAVGTIKPQIIEEAYYRVFRTIDRQDVISFGTGSSNATKMSFDVSGNYFDLDTSYLDKGYSYGIQFAYKLNGQYKVQPDIFKFRISEEEP